MISIAEGRFAEGIREYRQGAAGWDCHPCRLTDLARAFEAAGQTDSALAYWQQYDDVIFGYAGVDAVRRAESYVRLGELYEETGNIERSIEYYGNLVELWADADAELQPQVTDIRQRIARLVGER